MVNGCLKYESLMDGSVSLADVALLNDALDVLEENKRRCAEHHKHKA